MAGIDVNWTPGNERYCRGDDVIECDNICPLSGENLLENVDAWLDFYTASRQLIIWVTRRP